MVQNTKKRDFGEKVGVVAEARTVRLRDRGGWIGRPLQNTSCLPRCVQRASAPKRSSRSVGARTLQRLLRFSTSEPPWASSQCPLGGHLCELKSALFRTSAILGRNGPAHENVSEMPSLLWDRNTQTRQKWAPGPSERGSKVGLFRSRKSSCVKSNRGCVRRDEILAVSEKCVSEKYTFGPQSLRKGSSERLASKAGHEEASKRRPEARLTLLRSGTLRLLRSGLVEVRRFVADPRALRGYSAVPSFGTSYGRVPAEGL